MVVTKNKVLLLKVPRNDDTEDKFETVLKQNGYDVTQVKTLEFQFKNLAELKTCLEYAHQYSGIIFSSPRCVEATKLAMDGEFPAEEWVTKDNYVVGESTYEHAYKELNLDCLGKQTGNANNLAELMLKNSAKYKERPFLYPHGNLKMDILKSCFSGKIGLHEVCVYDTVPNPKIDDDLDLAVRTDVPEFIVFFSPSGLKACMNFLQRLPISDIKIIAIGPTTEAAMREIRMEVFGVCCQPTPEDLLKVISGL